MRAIAVNTAIVFFPFFFFGFNFAVCPIHANVTARLSHYIRRNHPDGDGPEDVPFKSAGNKGQHDCDGVNREDVTTHTDTEPSHANEKDKGDDI